MVVVIDPGEQFPCSLRRRGRTKSRWKGMAVHIADGYLFVFSSQGDLHMRRDPIMELNLNDAKFHEVASTDNHFGFRLTLTDGRVVDFLAESSDERDLFMIATSSLPMSLRSQTSSVLEGFLEKRGWHSWSWKKQYFILGTKQLTYRKLKTSDDDMGSIPLEEAKFITNASSFVKRQFSFGIVPASGTPTYWITAPDEFTFVLWLSAILPTSFPKVALVHCVHHLKDLKLPESIDISEGHVCLMHVPVQVIQTPGEFELIHLLIFSDIVVFCPARSNEASECIRIFSLQHIWIAKSQQDWISYAMKIGEEGGSDYVVFSPESEVIRNCIFELIFSQSLLLRKTMNNSARYGQRHLIVRDTLHSAALLGETAQLELLLTQHITPDFIDEDGCTPLHLAAFSGQVDCVLMLLKFQSDCLMPDYQGDSALHIACIRGDVPCVSALSAQKSSNLALLNADSHTPLWCCLFCNTAAALNCAQVLIRGGANPDYIDHSTGLTPVAYAARLDLSGVVQFLIQNDASLFIGFPLHIAVLNNSFSSAKLLLDYGTSPNMPDCDGRRPIDLEQSADMKQLLLSNGAGGYTCRVALSIEARSGDCMPIVGKHARHAHYDWVHDQEHPLCQACHVAFSIFRRRHHCRYCGCLCCTDCSTNRIRRSSCRNNGQFNIERICDGCYNRVRSGIQEGAFISRGISPNHPSQASTSRHPQDRQSISDSINLGSGEEEIVCSDSRRVKSDSRAAIEKSKDRILKVFKLTKS